MNIGSMDQMEAAFEGEIQDFTKNGKCSGCGQCCSNFLPMTEKEIKRIRRYVRENHIKPQNLPLVFSGPVIDMSCPFMRKDVSCDRCTIYPVKPKICSQFICNDPTSQLENHATADMRMVNVREEFF